jgi:hypothetical protein
VTTTYNYSGERRDEDGRGGYNREIEIAVRKGAYTQERRDFSHTHTYREGERDGNTGRSSNEHKGATVIQEETRRTKTNNGAIFRKGRKGLQLPSKGGTPIQSILLKQLTKGPGHSTEQEQPGIRADKIGEGAVAAENIMEVDLPKGNPTKESERRSEKEGRVAAQVKKTTARKPKLHLDQQK